jgi:hypothetical protein
VFGGRTQGSPRVAGATLGFGTESRWDSRRWSNGLGVELEQEKLGNLRSDLAKAGAYKGSSHRAGRSEGEGCNPFRVGGVGMGTAPRLATVSQTELKEGLRAFRGQMELKEGLPAIRGLPWAEGWNPVGIPARGSFSVWRRTVRVERGGQAAEGFHRGSGRAGRLALPGVKANSERSTSNIQLRTGGTVGLFGRCRTRGWAPISPVF